MSVLALDSSVAIPLLVRTHHLHPEVVGWRADREAALAGHALAETYSVITRLPSQLRVAPEDAAQLLADEFADPLLIDPATTRRLPTLLAERGVFGGAVYDALVGLAAVEHGAALATRDARAKDTYERVGARTEMLG